MAPSFHTTRSISLPSRILPNSTKIERSVNKFKSWDLSSLSTSVSRQGAEAIQLGLLGLVELYGDVQNLTLSPFAQQALLRHDRGKLVEEAIDDSLGLLDTCSIARDLILRLKQQVSDLQSALRRKGCSTTTSVKEEISVYSGFRKKMAKDVAKCLRELKHAEEKHRLIAVELNNPYLAMVVKVLRDVHVATVGVLRSLFLFMSMPCKASGWSLISRLVTKRPQISIFNEVAEVDFILQELGDAKVDPKVVGGRLKALEDSVGVLERELDCLFRSMLENRVSLLNILTQ